MHIFFWEGKCKFGEDCCYAHEKVSKQDLKVKERHENEINAIKNEIDKIKEIISLMQNKITKLNPEIQG